MKVGEWPTRWAQRYPDETCLKYGDLRLTKKEFNLRINQALTGKILKKDLQAMYGGQQAS